jgi:hypothetical protein
MEKRQTKRDYLIAKGLAKPGHGRFSNAAKEEIKKAINKGIKFGEPGEEQTSGVGATAEPRRDRPVGVYVFKNADGTKFNRMHTNACVECGYSFRWCKCLEGPHQWEHNGVTVKRAKLHSIPSRATVVNAPAPRKRAAPKKKG